MTFPDRFFCLSDHGTTVVTELRAGFVTFLTIVGMPFTYSIANVIALGLVSHVLIKLLTGRARTVPPLLYLLVALLVLYYAFIGGA